MTGKSSSHDHRPQQDWTTGPAKWAAVIVLGAASIFGIAWSVLTRTHTPSSSEPPGIPVHAAQQGEPEDTPRSSRTDESSGEHRPATPPPAPAIPDSTKPRDLVQGPHLPAWEQVSASASPSPDTDQTPEEPPEASDAPAAIRVNVNRADREELQLLPGIGPVMADRIVENRTRLGFFRSLDDLERITGIGPRTVEQLRPHAVVRERPLTPPDDESR